MNNGVARFCVAPLLVALGTLAHTRVNCGCVLNVNENVNNSWVTLPSLDDPCGKPREQVYSCARLYSARACMYYVACATR